MRLLCECIVRAVFLLVFSCRHRAEGFSNVVSQRNHPRKTTVVRSTAPDDIDGTKDGRVIDVDFLNKIFQNPYPSDHVGIPICEVVKSSTTTTTKKRGSSSKSKKKGGKKVVKAGRVEPARLARQDPNEVEYDKEDKFFDEMDTTVTRTYELQVDYKLSPISRLLLLNFREKYLYYCADDVIYTYKGNPSERDKLLGILYTPVLSLHNNHYIDFFGIWVDEVYIRDVPKKNKFLSKKDGLMEDFCYVTIKLLYTPKITSSSESGLW